MEKNNKTVPVASSYSWWCDGHDINNLPPQSQWLQAALSELDKKIRMMLTIIEEEEEEDDDDDDTFTMRAEKYYKNRPQLVKIIQDLRLSYRALADKYDQLRCVSNPLPLQVQHPIHKENELLVEPPNSNCEPLETDEICNGKEINGIEEGDIILLQGIEEAQESDREMGKDLRIKVSMLVDDNLKQQAELIRRNNEKRKAIKDLCVQIGNLMNENRALKTSLGHYKIDMKQNKSQISRFKGLLLRKFL